MTIEAKLRRPPAYQEYGSDLLSLEAVRMMTLAELGLLATMRWYVWANDTMPRDPAKLARALGVGAEEVREALTEAVLGFFRTCQDDQQRIYSPELSVQMQTLLLRRAERAASGSKGGKSSKKPRSNAQAELGAELKLAEKSRDERSRGELGSEGDISGDSFVREYAREQAA